MEVNPYLTLDNFYIHNPIEFNMLPTEDNINDLQNKIWYVIKEDSDSINDTFYDIKINDIIKLGRVKYAITEIKINNKFLSIEKSVDKPVFSLISDYGYYLI